MTGLPRNFRLEKYGIQVRLVTEEDAEFIVSLRSDKSRTEYMLTLDNDVEKQKEWIKSYKEREKRKEDYYFLYELPDGTKICVNRVSQIDYERGTCKAAGWIKAKDVKINSMAVFVLQKEIIYEHLELNTFYSDVHRRNKRVLSYYEEFGLKASKEEDEFLYFFVNRKEYENSLAAVKEKFFLNDR